VNAALGRPLEVHWTVLNSLPKYVQPSSQRSLLAVSGATRRNAPLLPVTSKKTISEVPLPLRFETPTTFSLHFAGMGTCGTGAGGGIARRKLHAVSFPEAITRRMSDARC